MEQNGKLTNTRPHVAVEIPVPLDEALKDLGYPSEGGHGEEHGLEPPELDVLGDGLYALPPLLGVPRDEDDLDVRVQLHQLRDVEDARLVGDADETRGDVAQQPHHARPVRPRPVEIH